jgi:hypothetical protein
MLKYPEGAHRYAPHIGYGLLTLRDCCVNKVAGLKTVDALLSRAVPTRTPAGIRARAAIRPSPDRLELKRRPVSQSRPGATCAHPGAAQSANGGLRRGSKYESTVCTWMSGGGLPAPKTAALSSPAGSCGLSISSAIRWAAAGSTLRRSFAR